jgi:putative phage-type endonuclease
MNEIENRVESLGKARLMGRYLSGSPEWHSARHGIGGSTIGTICGVNTYQSRTDALESILGIAPPIVPNIPMRLGTAFEDGIRKVWSEDHWELTVYQTGTWQSLENPFWKANPDGIIRDGLGDLSILEIKFSQASEVPKTWIYQVNWYMMILGLSKATIVQCKGNKLIQHDIAADPVIFDEMRAEAALFEKEVKEDGI